MFVSTTVCACARDKLDRSLFSFCFCFVAVCPWCLHCVSLWGGHAGPVDTSLLTRTTAGQIALAYRHSLSQVMCVPQPSASMSRCCWLLSISFPFACLVASILHWSELVPELTQRHRLTDTNPSGHLSVQPFGLNRAG